VLIYRSNVDNGRPIVVRDDTPTLDEESGQEVVEIIPTNKDNGKLILIFSIVYK